MQVPPGRRGKEERSGEELGREEVLSSGRAAERERGSKMSSRAELRLDSDVLSRLTSYVSSNRSFQLLEPQRFFCEMGIMSFTSNGLLQGLEMT